MDLRLCKYDKNSFGGIKRISVGLKSARCWDFPVTKKRQPQKRRKRRKKKRGKRRRAEKKDEGERDLVRVGLAWKPSGSRCFSPGRTKKILTVKQDLLHRVNVEEMSQREENVSKGGTCVVKRAAAATTCGHSKC